MHLLQTGGSRASIMSYSTIPIPASPTLTNPDMILPYVEYDSASPPGGNYRSACSGQERTDTRQIDMHFSIAPPRTDIALTTPIIYGNGTMLSDIGEVTEAESTPGRSKLPGPAERRMLKQKQASGNHAPIGSSPTSGYAAVMKRTRVGTHQRKISIESSSTVTSDGQAGEIFKDFDDGVSVDDSVFQGDDEESLADSHSEQVIASETQRLAMVDNQLEHEDDRNSSAALSRRAEQILLNAKKRLTNMEDNLTRARSSLCATPSGSLSSIHSSSPLSRSTPSPPENDKTAGAFSIYPPRQRLLHTPAESPAASPTNPRAGSENSILSQRMAPFPIPIPVRSVNTAARFTGRSDGGKRSPTLSQAPQAHCEDTRTIAHCGFFSSLSKGFPPLEILQPLSEDDGIVDFDADRESIRSSVDGNLRPNGEHRGLTRSASSMQMRDLKDQMSDLKGRLSVLRDRARSDTMKRRSLQSLRTPSPFTAAEQWYAASNHYGDPLSANAGVASPPWKGSQSGDDEARQVHEAIDGTSGQVLCVEDAASDITSVYEDINEHSGTFDLEDENEPRSSEAAEENYRIVEEDQQNEEAGEDYEEEIVDYKEVDHCESDTSVYHDSLSTQLSHEDREDAFDYEHFFLYSAMGTICQQKPGRRCSSGSACSEDSVETVQATPASKEPTRSIRGRVRSESTDSLSSLATFATATEGLQSEYGDEEERDTFAVQQLARIIPRSNTTTPLAAKRSTFGGAGVSGQIDDIQASFNKTKIPSSTGNDKIRRNGLHRPRPSVNSFKSFGFNDTLRTPPLVSEPELQQSKSSVLNLRASKEIEPSLLTDSTTLTDDTNGEHLQSSPIHMLAREDRILVQRIVASLGKCVLGLQEAGSASYEGRVWRRKIDNARKQLENDETGI